MKDMTTTYSTTHTTNSFTPMIHFYTYYPLLIASVDIAYLNLLATTAFLLYSLKQKQTLYSIVLCLSNLFNYRSRLHCHHSLLILFLK